MFIKCSLLYVYKEYGYIHLSAGELLRAERKKPDSEVGLLIEKHIQEGTIVPVEITCQLLQQVTLQETQLLPSDPHSMMSDTYHDLHKSYSKDLP